MVVIDAYRGGNDTGYTGNGILEKDFNLKISKYMNDRLKELGINTYLTRDTDTDLNINQRSDLIKDAFGNNRNVIAISNRLNYGDEEGVEIVYSLKNSNALADALSNAFSERDIYVNKVYQRRDENDTSMDYDELLKNTGNIQTIIVNYGYINNKNDIEKVNNDYKKYAESVIKTLATQLGVPYNYTLTNEYIVQKGDSLWAIANKFNTTVDELKNINNLKSNLLNIGQILKLPTSEEIVETKDTYTVKKGDSLYQIALKYNTTVDELKNINNLTSNLLSIGQVLKLPSTSVSTSTTNTYIVQKGDSLYQIALKYNTTVDELKSINNLTSNLLSIGQVLKLPSSSTNQKIYIVKKGDSLYQIALKYNTTVDKLKSINNLTSNLLSIGQELILP